MAERAVGAMVVVIVLPGLQSFAGVVQRDELVDVEELVAQSPVVIRSETVP
jgi:hypothetical protein